MPGPRIAAAFRVTQEQVDMLTRDLRMIEQGAALFVCFDPYEIINYCFPITPGVEYIEATIDEIADDQAALEFGLFSEDFRPILIDEYAAELDRYLQHLAFQADRAYQKATLVQELERAAGLGTAGGDQTRQYRDLEEVKDEFNISLAVTLGKLSLGLERLREVTARTRRRTEFDARIREALGSYKSGPVGQAIYEKLLAEIEKMESDPASKRRQMRNALVDATAIDRLLHANRVLAADTSSPRLILLYVSSAGRNRSIFSIPAVEAAMPVIDGQPYDIWRTREQLFVALMHKGTERDSVLHWINRLSSWKEHHVRVPQLHNKLGRQPGVECATSECILSGGTPPVSCKWLELCRVLNSDMGQIKAKRAEIKNLGLIASITTYTRVLESLQKLQGDPSAQVKVVVAALASSDMRDLAMHQMQVENSMLLAKHELRLAIADRQLEAEGQSSPLEDDGVTNLVQSLPRRPRLLDPECRDLADRLIRYYERPSLSVVEAAKFVEGMQREFAVLEARSPEGSGELELLRCLLYLAYPLRSGDARVVSLTDQNCKKYPEQEVEFLYVGCWAARRMNRYAESILFADRGMGIDSNDARFHHGRSLSIYCWIASGVEGCSKVLQDAVNDALRAVELLESNRASDPEMLSACYNNIAYFCLQSKPVEKSSLEMASKFFAKLVKLLPRAQWTPRYPEYFHTESVLLYHQYLGLKEGGAKEGTARPLLIRARAQLRKAMTVESCREYVELYDALQLLVEAKA